MIRTLACAVTLAAFTGAPCAAQSLFRSAGGAPAQAPDDPAAPLYGMSLYAVEPPRPVAEKSDDRESWGGRIEFLLSCLGYCVGLGNVCWFPYKCASNGGGTFLIPWAIFLFTWSVPLLIAEFALGRGARRG